MSEKITGIANATESMNKALAANVEATTLVLTSTQEAMNDILNTNILSIETIANKLKKKNGDGGLVGMALDTIKSEISGIIKDPLGKLGSSLLKAFIPKSTKAKIGKIDDFVGNLPSLLNVFGLNMSKKGGVMGKLGELINSAFGGKIQVIGYRD